MPVRGAWVRKSGFVVGHTGSCVVEVVTLRVRNPALSVLGRPVCPMSGVHAPMRIRPGVSVVSARGGFRGGAPVLVLARALAQGTGALGSAIPAWSTCCSPLAPRASGTIASLHLVVVGDSAV
jgi:hypothetical protein